MTPESASLDLATLRADTPGCAHRNHLNNAGAALMPTPVLDAVRDHLRLEEETGGYEAADARQEELARAYVDVEALLEAQPGTVAFTGSATESFTQALSSVPWRPGDVLLTTRDDYASNQIQYLSLARRMGVELVRAPDAEEGGLDLPAMEELIHRRRPRLVAVTHIPTNSGLVQPVAAVGRMCRSRGIPYLVDACQSVGQMPLDVEEIGCDFLSATARKFLRGPRGAGFLYVSPRILDSGWEPLFPDLRGADWVGADLYQPAPDARRFETWEFSHGLLLGMGAAARYAMDLGLPAVRDRIRALAALARRTLGAIPGVTVLDRGPELGGIVTLSVTGWDAVALVPELRKRRINTSALTRVSAVMDFDARGIETALRVSPHVYNTPEEIEALAVALGELVEVPASGPSR
jgi:selenocysteine lyase/cysteine desulfurase